MGDTAGSSAPDRTGEEAKTLFFHTNMTMLHRGKPRPDSSESPRHSPATPTHVSAAPMTSPKAPEHSAASRRSSKSTPRQSGAMIRRVSGLRRGALEWILFRGVACPDVSVFPQSVTDWPCSTAERWGTVAAGSRHAAARPKDVAPTRWRSAEASGRLAAAGAWSAAWASGVWVRPLG